MSEKQKVPNQVGKMLGQLVEHQQCFLVMPVYDREWVIRNTSDAIALFIKAVKNRAESVPPNPLTLVLGSASYAEPFCFCELHYIGLPYVV